MSQNTAGSTPAHSSMLSHCATNSSMWDLTDRRLYETARGYVLVYLPQHPNARNGTIFLHRVVMENELGRPLQEGEIVHHRNGDKSDNHPENLELTTQSAHASLHAEERPKRGETLVELVCPFCDETFTRPTRNVSKGEERSFCSRSCSTSFNGRRGCTISHGTYGRYRKGCRCDECRGANAEKSRKHRSAS